MTLLSAPGAAAEGGGSGAAAELASSTPSPRSAQSSPRKSHLHGIALSAQDLQDPHLLDAQENHERTQLLFQQLLKHRGFDYSATAPFVHPAKERGLEDDDHRRYDLSQRIFGRLRQRGIHALRCFRRHLHAMDVQQTGTVSCRTLEGALSHMGFRLKASEYEQMLELFSADREAETIDYLRLLAHGCSNWSKQREEVVAEGYSGLAERCPGGKLTASSLEQSFKPRALHSKLIPELLDHHSAAEFLSQWSDSNLGGDGVITWNDFLDYYLDVSLCFDSDPDFCHYVCASWGIDLDDWLAKKVFRHYTDPAIQDVLPAKDFRRMLSELDPTITEEEALAWYQAIDEDDSGEVSLQEFLSSKVLKVKRLFDQFDEGDTRKASKEQTVEILRSLNDAITNEEAAAICEYADLDNSGDISFVEFLVNNLLKLLKVFDEFDKDRHRALDESQLKALLRKADPYLDDGELHEIYKAMRVDGGGSISFVVFCQSHVLRAKSIFDRYDTDRSRALSGFQFRELMLDLDSQLTVAQADATFILLSDSDTQKVHLGSFLNPNIIRLKMLFDKYDHGKKRYLNSEEFKHTLKDMYKDHTDKEVEAIVQNIFYPGTDQRMCFSTYIARFKEITQKHDLIVCAKRRAAREKAQSKGLVYKQ